MRGSGWHLELYCDIATCKAFWSFSPVCLGPGQGEELWSTLCCHDPRNFTNSKDLSQISQWDRMQEPISPVGCPTGRIYRHKLIQICRRIVLKMLCRCIALGHTFGCQSCSYLQGNDSACSHMLLHLCQPCLPTNYDCAA